MKRGRISEMWVKARQFDNQKVECQVKCLIMNKMLSLGVPISEPVFEMAA